MIKIKLVTFLALVLLLPSSLWAFGWNYSNFWVQKIGMKDPVVEISLQDGVAKGTVFLDLYPLEEYDYPVMGSLLLFMPPESIIVKAEALMAGEWRNSISATPRAAQETIDQKIQESLDELDLNSEGRIRGWTFRDPVFVEALGNDVYRVKAFPVEEGFGKVRIHFEQKLQTKAGQVILPLPSNAVFYEAGLDQKVHMRLALEDLESQEWTINLLEDTAFVLEDVTAQEPNWYQDYVQYQKELDRFHNQKDYHYFDFVQNTKDVPWVSWYRTLIVFQEGVELVQARDDVFCAECQEQAHQNS
jgi:hypothetical protein